MAVAAAIIPVAAISSTANTGGFSLASLASAYKMFYGDGELTGGNGTTYNSNITDADGAVVDSDDDAGYLTVKEEDEDYDVKYAVCIWGINQDTYSTDEGVTTDTAGLTFGPAAGSNYTDSYSAHMTYTQFTTGHFGVCIHWMTWEEIIIQSLIDPTVFEDCLENGCTHSVELVLNDTISSGTSYAGSMDSGDGAAALFSSIADDYRIWSLYGGNSYGGWKASRIRATLNGKSSDTYVGSTDIELTEDTCLLSCFPETLQEAIVPKVTTWNLYSGCYTVYDRLWLFSVAELGSDKASDGTAYQKMSYISASSSLYSETRAQQPGWLRTTYLGNTSSVYIGLNASSGINTASADNSSSYSIAPGFCIP